MDFERQHYNIFKKTILVQNFVPTISYNVIKYQKGARLCHK